MGKCLKCERKGIFLKLNSDGLCSDCALEEAAKRESELVRAREFVKQISAAFSDIAKSGGHLPVSGSGSWIDVKEVPLDCVRRLREDCSSICSEFPHWADYPLFEEAFLEECVPDPKVSSCYVHPCINIGLLRKRGNDFGKKIPKLIQRVRALESALILYGEYEYKTFRVVGVTFQNEDGRSRQEILKKIRYRGAPYRSDPDIRLVKRDYNGGEAVAVYANEEQIGHISEIDLSFVLPRWGRYKDVDKFSIHGTGDRDNKFGIDIQARFYKER